MTPVRLIKTGQGNALAYRLEDITPLQLARLQLGLISCGFDPIGAAFEERPPEFRSWRRAHLTLLVREHCEPPWPPAPPPGQQGC